MKKTIKGPSGIKIELDSTQVFPDDPGAGTPAMVYLNEYCATYWCACGEGELLSDRRGTKRLTPDQLNWLERKDEEVTNFLY